MTDKKGGLKVEELMAAVANGRLKVPRMSSVPAKWKLTLGSRILPALMMSGALACVPNTREENLRSGSKVASVNNKQQQPEKKKCLGVVGGAPTVEHPQVGFIFQTDKRFRSGCTGTFLSDTTMLTASHCLTDSPDGGMLYIPGDAIDLGQANIEASLGRGVPAVKAFIGAPSLTKDKPKVKGLDDHERDIAVLVFPSGTFKSFASILSTPLTEDQDLTLVGYGDTVAPNYSPGPSAPPAPPAPSPLEVKRSGTNRLAKMAREMRAEFHPDFYFVVGDASSNGETNNGKAVVGYGDSGGPLLLKQLVAAVASAGGIAPPEFKPYINNAESFSAYVSLQSTFAKEFLQRAIDGGATMNFAARPLEADVTKTENAAVTVAQCE
ncbi:MAG: S1 family peptidase [Deltaproteobacteria bacterium]|nr:S1 family peptidase [Deltaproteobacteria bacterium]